MIENPAGRAGAASRLARIPGAEGAFGGGGAGVTRRRRARRILFVTRDSINRAIFVSLVVAVALSPWYANESLWIGVGLLLIGTIGWHGLAASKSVPWIPGLIAAVAAAQWVFIPWIAYHVPPSFAAFAMAVPPPEYFSYAVPATVALVLGLYLPLLRLPVESSRPAKLLPDHQPSSEQFKRAFDALVIMGIIVRVVLMPFVPTSLRFAATLVWQLGLVGALGLILIRAPGWPLRSAAVLIVQASYASADGMFHDLLLWLAYFTATIAFSFKLRSRQLALLIAMATLMVFALNGIKQEYRAAIGRQQLSLVARGRLLVDQFAKELRDPAGLFSGKRLSYNVTRLNQGWIISRTLDRVPNIEPFARGETILSGVQASLLPRALFPDKLMIGRGQNFERFTGVPLRVGTSMDLSLAGEMYVNFGRWGGIVGVFLFALGLGFLFRLLALWAVDSSLWWAWAPFLVLPVMKAESSLAEGLNHLVKASVVMVLVISVQPVWTALRRWRLLRSRRPARPQRIIRTGPFQGSSAHGP